jgi:hypothetical protein
VFRSWPFSSKVIARLPRAKVEFNLAVARAPPQGRFPAYMAAKAGLVFGGIWAAAGAPFPGIRVYSPWTHGRSALISQHSGIVTDNNCRAIESHTCGALIALSCSPVAATTSGFARI